MGNMSSKNTINDASYQGLKATSGAAHVSIQNTAVTLQYPATGDTIAIAAGATRTQSLGDLTAYGLPFGDVILTAAGTTDVYSGAWAAGNGVLYLQVLATGTTDALSVSVKNVNLTAMAGPFGLVTSVGDVITAHPAATTTTTLYTLYTGVGAVS